LNRTDIVRAVSNHESLPISLCEKVIGGLLDVLALSLAAGEPVNLRRFGKFEPRLPCPEWEPRSQFVTHLVDVVVANA
jgi:nucleoid DNA-binding protein